MSISTKHTIQIFEHQTIRVGDLLNGISFDEATFKALALYHERQSTKYFSLLYQGIKFSHYVGVIQVGQLTLEILPKADKVTKADPAKWQAVLVEMLQYCQLLKIESTGMGQVSLNSNAILDLYFGRFLSDLKQLIINGLPKQYISQESNQKVLKGRLDLPKQLRKNGLHPERFYVHHQSYAYNHLFNRVLHEALSILKRVHLNDNLQLRLRQVIALFPNLPNYTITARDFEQLFQSQKYRPYHDLLEMCRLILLNFSPDIRTGRHHLFALLFDMNQLYEEYVYRQLKKLERTDLKVQRQTSKPFWQRRTIRPDLVVKINDHKYVLDTKWKILRNNSPSMEDLKQLYIYGQYFSAQRGILLYPKVYNIENSPTIPFQPIEKESPKIYGQVVFLNILNEMGQLNKKIGKDLVDLLE